MFKRGDILRFGEGQPPAGWNKGLWPRDDLYVFRSYETDSQDEPQTLVQVTRIRDGQEIGVYPYRMEKVDDEI